MKLTEAYACNGEAEHFIGRWKNQPRGNTPKWRGTKILPRFLRGKMNISNGFLNFQQTSSFFPLFPSGADLNAEDLTVTNLQQNFTRDKFV